LDKQLQSLVDEIESASGKIDADMHIANLRILDVYTETVYPGAMVIKNGKIVAVNPSWTVQAEQVFDGRGMFAVPGFMDAQVHIEGNSPASHWRVDELRPRKKGDERDRCAQPGCRGHGVRPPGTVHEPLVCVPAHGSGTGIDRPGAYQCEGTSKNTGGGRIGVIKSYTQIDPLELKF